CSQRKKSFRLPLKATSMRWGIVLKYVLVSSRANRGICTGVSDPMADRQRLLEKLTHSEELVAPPPNELVRLVAAEVLELADQRVVDGLRGRLVIGVRAAGRLRNDLVDHALLEQILRGDAERARRLLAHLLTLAVLPQNRGAAFDRDHRIDRVL